MSALEDDQVVIVPMTEVHWPTVHGIYALGIATGHATFEAEPPTWEHFDATRLPDQRHVALNHDGGVLGWIVPTPVSDRCVYAGIVEHSVYVHPDAQGRGIGSALLRALIASTEEAGQGTRCLSAKRMAKGWPTTKVRSVTAPDLVFCAPSGTRTPNPLIKSQLLCQLS